MRIQPHNSLSYRVAVFLCFSLISMPWSAEALASLGRPSRRSCKIDGSLVQAGAINPKNPCEACLPEVSTASWSLAQDGMSCNDDGDLCNGARTCIAGACSGTRRPVRCQALDACHVAGVCDPATGFCTNPPVPDGTPCVGSAAAGTCNDGSCACASAGQACDIGTPDGCCSGICIGASGGPYECM
jgi:hypothetical protein